MPACVQSQRPTAAEFSQHSILLTDSDGHVAPHISLPITGVHPGGVREPAAGLILIDAQRRVRVEGWRFGWSVLRQREGAAWRCGQPGIPRVSIEAFEKAPLILVGRGRCAHSAAIASGCAEELFKI
jgi:hypothetical protein